MRVIILAKKIIFVVLTSIIIINCMPNTNKGPDLFPEATRKTISDAPKWYIQPPVKEGFRYEAATATSQDMQLAIDKARNAAATTLAGLVQSEWNGLVKRVQEETGLGANSHIIDQFSQSQEQIISKELHDLRVAETLIQEEKSDFGRIYRGYVLVEYNENGAHERLLSEIKANEELFTIMRSIELFEEMEQKVEAYKQRN